MNRKILNTAIAAALLGSLALVGCKKNQDDTAMTPPPQGAASRPNRAETSLVVGAFHGPAVYPLMLMRTPAPTVLPLRVHGPRAVLALYCAMPGFKGRRRGRGVARGPQPRYSPGIRRQMR